MQHILIRQYPEHTFGPVILNDSETSKVVVAHDLACMSYKIVCCDAYNLF